MIIKNNLNTEPERVQSSSVSESIWQGVKWSALAYPLKLGIFRAIHDISVSVFNISSGKIPVSYFKNRKNFIYPVLIGPLLEEILIRVLFQNLLKKTQERLPDSVPQWMKSKNTRIVITATAFAALHIAFLPRITGVAVARVAFLVLLPVESILYEKYGFIAAYSSHAVHNFLTMITR